MKKQAQKAFNKLQSMGVLVMHPSPTAEPTGGYDGSAHFAISGEGGHKDDSIIVDYWYPEYGDFGVDPRIVEVLNKYGLYCEWYNAGVLDVHDA